MLGLAGNSRLHKRIARESRKAKLKPARVFADFEYRTRDSWSAKRRVIGKTMSPGFNAGTRICST